MVSELKKGPQVLELKIMIDDYKLEVVKNFKYVGVHETMREWILRWLIGE
jgi:hypothetical protein